MKYSIDWTESKKFLTCWSCHSLIKTFAQVYGVREFTIKFGKYQIKGSTFIDKDVPYDFAFHYMLSCFLTPKKIVKVYKELIKNAK